MSAWLVPIILAAAGLVWLEVRRPERVHLASRVAAVVTAVAALVVLLSLRSGRGPVTLLTPGATIADRSPEAVDLDQAQSLTGLAVQHAPIRLAGWGLLPHEWPESLPLIAGFDRSPLPAGIVRLDAPTEIGVGERLVIRGTVLVPDRYPVRVVLEDPSGARDSASVSAEEGEFELNDRPRAPGAVAYRLRLRGSSPAEEPETLAVSVRPPSMPALLLLDASPSFESATLKRWLGDRGARVSVRTAISRQRFRSEGINGAPSKVGALTPALLERFDAVLADGGSLAALSPAERRVLDRQVRERGLGLLITADVPWLLGRGTCGLMKGIGLEPVEVATAGPRDRGIGRVTRPVLVDAPRQTRTGITAEPVALKPDVLDPLVRDDLGRILAGSRRAGQGSVALTLLRAPSRWLLEGEPDLYAAYWYGLLRAVTRDTTTRVQVSAEGPLRADHPVNITLRRAGGPESGSPPPVAAVAAPGGQWDTLALAQDPFDPARRTGRYWPRTAGWHRLVLGGNRTVAFRVTGPTEWIGLEARARLAASVPRSHGAGASRPGRDHAGVLLGPLAFAALLVALTWLWLEGRRAR